MPEQFLLSYVGFSADNVPIIDVQVGDTISRYPLLGHTLSLTFDLSVRYCTGWVDMAQHQAHPCPDNATVVDRYEQCLVCRNKTGFNPAFYHAKTISKQQETLNQNPHFVYLAYFAPELIKVGISQEARGIRRILEQGARAAIKNSRHFPVPASLASTKRRLHIWMESSNTSSIAESSHYCHCHLTK